MGKNNWQGIFGHMVQYLLTLQQYGKMVTTTVMKLPECTTNGSRMICSLNLSSFRVTDTLGHTSTSAFSVDSELLRYFAGHADAFQIL